jgi:hypothetical protein
LNHIQNLRIRFADAANQINIASNRRQRRSQFMGNIGQEALADMEQLLQAFQVAVKDHRQIANFVPPAGVRQAAAQIIVVENLERRFGDTVQWLQLAVYDQGSLEQGQANGRNSGKYKNQAQLLHNRHLIVQEAGHLQMTDRPSLAVHIDD